MPSCRHGIEEVEKLDANEEKLEVAITRSPWFRSKLFQRQNIFDKSHKTEEEVKEHCYD